MEITEYKSEGRYYTPPHIVNAVLSEAYYTADCTPSCILKKHIIDNSCGDGAFLKEIVRRYCKEALKNNYTKQQLIYDLQHYIHGIELNPIEHKKAIQTVTDTVRQFDIQNNQWDIINANALTTTKYNGKMDYVVGNPPYIRVHNLNDSYDTIKQFQFAQEGMTDMFIVFYEIGLNMLKPNGILSYITPSSLFHSKAAYKLRKHLIQNKLLHSVVNLQHYQPFKATTYTAIFTLQPLQPNRNSDMVYYSIYNPKQQDRQYVSSLYPNLFYINGNFYFGTEEELKQLNNILYTIPDNHLITVKNGFATLLDSFFIGNYQNFSHTIPIIKASTAKQSYCIFPYDKNGKLLPYNTLTQDTQLKQHYKKYETQLKNRSLQNKQEWYGFGRTQAINDVYKNKYSLSSIINSQYDLKLTQCRPGTGVYGGLYILSDLSLQQLENILYTDNFFNYIKLLSKYKSGGYYTFSSNDINIYLHHFLNTIYTVK